MSTTSPIIDFKSLTSEQILNLLGTYVAGRSDASKWADFYDASNFTVVKEMIGGMAEFASFHELVNRREGYLDTAKFLTSIFELAFHQGVYVVPYQTAVIDVILANPSTGTSLVIAEGDYIGTISVDYEVYANEATTIAVGTSGTVECVVGKKTTETIPYSDITKFSTIEVLTEFKYPALQLETLTAPSPVGEIVLSTDVYTLTRESVDDIVLRRVRDSAVELYIGNGVLGWWGTSTTGNLVYEVLSFGDDLGSRLTESIIPVISGHTDVTYTSHIVVTNPTYGIEKETLRRLAKNYPSDTKMVQDRNYEDILLNLFAGQILDVYAHYEDEPNESLILEYIKGDDWVAVTTLANVLIGVNERRAQGIQIDHDTAANVYATTDGKEFPITAVVGSYSDIETEITDYLATQLNIFMKTDDENADIVIESVNIDADTSDDSFNVIPIIDAEITISATTTTNVFNDSGSGYGTSLSPGDTILVSGWTSPATANNGTFTVATATTSDIVVTSTLVSKAAGDSITVITKPFETSVSGLKKDDLILVSGWTSPATVNNGLFLIADDPTTAKLEIKDTYGEPFNLTTKAVGDTIIIKKVQKKIFTIYEILALLSKEFERPFNAHGYVVSGFKGAAVGSLTMTRATGIANIRGITYNIETGDSRLVNKYTTNKDTYVFLHKDGTFRYEEVAIDATAPATPIDTIKIEKVVTVDAYVLSVTDLRETESVVLAPNQFLKSLDITFLNI